MGMGGTGWFVLVGEVGGLCGSWACSCGRGASVLLVRWVEAVMMLGSGVGANIEGVGIWAAEGLSIGRLSSLRMGSFPTGERVWLCDSLPGRSPHGLWDAPP